MEGNLVPSQEEKIQIDQSLLMKQEDSQSNSSKLEINKIDTQGDAIKLEEDVQLSQINVKPGYQPNESSIIKQNNESTMINANASMVDESQNRTGIIEQLLNKSLFENPASLKHVSVFMDGLVNFQEKIPVTFKLSLLKDSIICQDDSKAKISFLCKNNNNNNYQKLYFIILIKDILSLKNLIILFLFELKIFVNIGDQYQSSNEDGDIELMEEVMLDLDMKKLVEKNIKSLDKYNIVVNILDQKGNLLYWHFSPLFKKDDLLNIEDFQVKLYKPPFQVPTRINFKKVVESDVICKYGIGFTDIQQKQQQQPKQ